jgi:hypothetical protein
VPQRVNIHQDRILASRDNILAMAIDRLQEIGCGYHGAEALMKSLHRCQAFTRRSFNVLHPGIGTTSHDAGRSQFRNEAVVIHPLQ